MAMLAFMKASRLVVSALVASHTLISCSKPPTPPAVEPAEPRSTSFGPESQGETGPASIASLENPVSEAVVEPPVDRDKCGLPPDLREPTWPRVLDPKVELEPDPLQSGTTTIAVLPDTQYYASCEERHFPEQGKWLASQIQKRNIVAAIHLGDLTEHNTPKEWEYVRDALSPLFDKIPLFLATGNHDYGTDGTADKRTTLFADYFGTPQPKTASSVAEVMSPGTIENAYYRLRLPGVTLGILVLEWSPTKAAVAWARKAVAAYPYDRKIFITHAYLFHDGTRYDFATKGNDQPWNPHAYGTAKLDPSLPYSKRNASPEGTYDGEMLWKELLKDMPGLFLTLNGHVLGDGSGLLTSAGYNGEKVHQMLTNFQMLDEGGLGYLRLIEIAPDGATIRMKTYSPSLDRFALASDQHFVLPIDPPLF